MSIKEVMMIQDTIQETVMAAGLGDFSRTAFEYSAEILQNDIPQAYTKILAKFVAPENGIYKYTFQCKGTSSYYLRMRKKSYGCPTATGAYYNTKGALIHNLLEYNQLNNFYEDYIGKSTDAYAYFSSGDTDPFSPFINPEIPSKLASYTEIDLYFPASKGEAITFVASRHSTDSTSSTRHSFKNQKITY